MRKLQKQGNIQLLTKIKPMALHNKIKERNIKLYNLRCVLFCFVFCQGDNSLPKSFSFFTIPLFHYSFALFCLLWVCGHLFRLVK